MSSAWPLNHESRVLYDSITRKYRSDVPHKSQSSKISYLDCFSACCMALFWRCESFLIDALAEVISAVYRDTNFSTLVTSRRYIVLATSCRMTSDMNP
jgi:hypothetical protein